MKRILILVLCVFCFAALAGCNKKEVPPTPVTAVQENEEKPLGTVFAHVENGDFYYNTENNQTTVLYKTDAQTRTLATMEGSWRFSEVKTKEAYPYMLFDGYTETAQGYLGRLFCYNTQTGMFFPFFEEVTSNAVLLPTTDENYADLAWVLVQFADGGSLCPINLRDGSIEMGQIVPLAERGYLTANEGELVFLKTDAEQPLQLTIENRSYAGDSIVSVMEFSYDFETNIFEGDELVDPIEEESEQDD